MAAVPSIGRATQVQPRPAAPEADATRALYERYHRQIFSFCLHQLGNREEAEDAVQGTFLNAFRGLKSGIVPEHESAWVFKIASNVCMTRRRAGFRRGRVESASDLQAFQDVIPGPKAPGDELMGLSEALAAMPDQQRTAILLREWQGLSYREIAEDMKLTQGAVETLIFRARRTLASGLEEQQSTSKLSRLRHAGDFGSLLAAAKTFLAGSAAVKVAATVAIATTTVVATETKPANPTDRKAAFVQKIQNDAPLVAPAVVAPAGSVTQRPVVGVPPAEGKAAPVTAAVKRAQTKRAVADVLAALLSSPATTLSTAEHQTVPQPQSPESSPAGPAAAVDAPAPAATPSEQPATQAGAAEPKREAPRGAAPAEQPRAEQPRAEQPKAEQPKAEQPKAVVAATERPRAEHPKNEAKREQPKSDARAEQPKAEEPKAQPASGESKNETPAGGDRGNSEQPKGGETRGESKAESKNEKDESRGESKGEGKNEHAAGEQPKAEAPGATPPATEQAKVSEARSDKAAEKSDRASDRSEKSSERTEKAAEKNERSSQGEGSQKQDLGRGQADAGAAAAAAAAAVDKAAAEARERAAAEERARSEAQARA